ncbi:hypothetical protein BH23ACT3_BH23ACT3_15400 [soil metagenome]
MFCNRCGTEARPGQKFCADCGVALEPAIEPDVDATQPVAVVDGNGGATGSDELPTTVELPAAAAFPVTAFPAPGSDPDHESAREPATRPLPAPVAAPPRLYDLALDEPDLLHDPPRKPMNEPVNEPVTQPLPGPAVGRAPAATDQLPATPTRLLDDADDAGGIFSQFRIGVVSGLGLVAGMTALFGMFTRVVAIRSDAGAPTFDTGDWLVADLGTNLPGAMIVALAVLLAGVIGAGFRQRWGAGLAGGAGLAIAGWVALTIGLSERPIERAVDAVGRPTTEAFTVTITRDVGYWVLLAAGVLGVLTFAVSLGSAGRDRRRGLNPWVASLGAVAAVIAAAGPLLPQGGAVIDDNWSPGSGGLGLPTWFVVGRLVQLGLVAYAGVIGFLLVSRYGLGLAIGGMTVSVWLALSTLLGLGDAPVGPGFANPGSRSDPIELHAVTIVGMIGLVGLAVVAVIAAYDQAAREYR